MMKMGMFLAVAATAVLGEDIKDNYVYFDSNQSLTVNYSLARHSITSGQPWGGVTESGSSILVKAGRHNSVPVSAAFVDGLSLVNVLVTMHAFDALPHDLNFAIFGNLTVAFASGQKAVCHDFRIAQGHYSVHNNWWMGSPSCESTPTTQRMTCICDGINLEFHAEDDSDHMYVLPGAV